MSTAPPKTTSRRTRPRPTDADQARDLVRWCRANAVHVSRVRVGDVELDGLADLSRFPAPSEVVATSGAGTGDLKAQFAGEALERLRRDEQRTEGGSVVVDADD